MEELLSWAGRARCIRIVSTGAVGRRLLVRLRCFEASGGARAFHMSKDGSHGLLGAERAIEPSRPLLALPCC